jgi:hypothetical protein
MRVKTSNRFVPLCGLLFMFTSSLIFGQDVISSSGDFHSTSSNSISWTIGEPVIDTWTAGGTVITQGFQQPILDIVSVYEYPHMDFLINAFPNPTSDFLNLEITNGDFEKMSFHLFDITGKLIESKEITSQQTEILFASLPAAMYYLRIMHNNKEVKTFKIIKK